jgi:RimJ/RimL family protein N-acetyltransferase
VSFELHDPAEMPPGYPKEYERELRLNDGRHVRVRPLVPADAPRLAAAIEAADADTLRRRFLGEPPRVTAALLTYLTELDYVRRFALVAADAQTGRGIAIARYEPLDPGVAEVAVVVDPAWRRVGMATSLIEMLAQAALDRGVHAFSATYLAESRSVAALLARADSIGQQSIRQGIAEVVVALDRAKASTSRAVDRG